MTEGHRRGVTRGYVWGLIFAVVIVSFALMLAAWSALALLTGGGPVTTEGIGFEVSAFAVLLCIGLLLWVLWAQSILLLRGRRAVSWTHVLLATFGGYLAWSLVGTLTGLSLADTWLSPYALSLALAWGVGALLCWAVLLRRVYTERPVPRWPWEKRGDPGPDWANTGEDPWAAPDDDRRDDER